MPRSGVVWLLDRLPLFSFIWGVSLQGCIYVARQPLPPWRSGVLVCGWAACHNWRAKMVPSLLLLNKGLAGTSPHHLEGEDKRRMRMVASLQSDLSHSSCAAVGVLW